MKEREERKEMKRGKVTGKPAGLAIGAVFGIVLGILVLLLCMIFRHRSRLSQGTENLSYHLRAEPYDTIPGMLPFKAFMGIYQNQIYIYRLRHDARRSAFTLFPPEPLIKKLPSPHRDTRIDINGIHRYPADSRQEKAER